MVHNDLVEISLDLTIDIIFTSKSLCWILGGAWAIEGRAICNNITMVEEVRLLALLFERVVFITFSSWPKLIMFQWCDTCHQPKQCLNMAFLGLSVSISSRTEPRLRVRSNGSTADYMRRLWPLALLLFSRWLFFFWCVFDACVCCWVKIKLFCLKFFKGLGCLSWVKLVD